MAPTVTMSSRALRPSFTSRMESRVTRAPLLMFSAILDSRPRTTNKKVAVKRKPRQNAAAASARLPPNKSRRRRCPGRWPAPEARRALGRGADAPQLLQRLGRGVCSPCSISRGELVHRVDAVQPAAAQGDVPHLGAVMLAPRAARGQKCRCSAQRAPAPALVGPGDAAHGFIHPKDLGPAGKQDLARHAAVSNTVSFSGPSIYRPSAVKKTCFISVHALL